MTARLYVILSVLILVVIFAIQNAEVVPVRFLFWGINISRALLLFLVLAVGVATGWGLHAFVHRKKKDKGAPKTPAP